ncbi:MAG: sialate O-acetylesterase [Oscillospiraceae bacterium]|jgi:sialate O-acetylesterase|nr:sialate O-acetylesterase [Oscillospiraceae bacterium]
MNLHLAAIFGDDMVLQREVPVPLWGSAPAGAEVAAEMDGQSVRTRAGEDGLWRLELPAGPAGGPCALTVRCGEDEITLRRVYRGEVWLAGGQSNMELALKDSLDGGAAVRDSANPRLHLYMAPKAATPEEAELLERSAPPAWMLSGPETAGAFSAVAWYAGKVLTEHLPDVHIGVVSCCWGGTYAHCWLPREELASFPEGQARIDGYDARTGGKSDEAFAQELAAYQKAVDAWNARIAARRAREPDVAWETLNEACGLYPWPPPAGRTGFQRPGNLYDAMLSRIKPYALRGFWYYQGEQDEEWPQDYHALLTRLIRRWRQDWGGEEKPFLLLQLPMYISKADSLSGDPMRWPLLRKAQSDAARELPDTHLAVLADCGEFDNIHPVDKRTPGTRLGMLALEAVYGLPVTGRPPVCGEVWREGAAAMVRFDHAGGRLRLTDGGFQLAGGDGVFRAAEARTVSADTVRVTAPGIESPAAVRYAWYSYGPAGLYGGTGLAAAPLNEIL